MTSDDAGQNTSGMGKSATLPPEIKGWNWGAFWLTWIWGIRNRTYIAFLSFIPFVSVVMPFILGAKGNKWAWQHEKWDSIEQYKASQRKWAMWGLIIFLIVISITIGVGAWAIFTSFLFPVFQLRAVAGILTIIAGITGIASGAFLAIVTEGPLGILATIFVSMGRREFAQP